MELKENFSSVFWGKKEEIFEKIESSHGKNCFLCNLEIYENFHSSNENISNHFLKKHFKFAVEFEVKGRKGFSLPCRKQECLDRKSETEARRSHFHCPFCTHVFGRSTPLKHHLVTKNGECGSIKSSSDCHQTTNNKQLPSTSTESQGKHENCSVTHEDILNSLQSPQQNTANLRTMCETIGVNSAGSRDDIIHRLNELILFKELYPKVYRQIRKCGGGIVHFRCPHGICVYFKYIARQESARDYIDGCSSWGKPPTWDVSAIQRHAVRMDLRKPEVTKRRHLATCQCGIV
ncbi:unnamed protein product [Clavelina lepadiformis]|uniref:SAP domain-containing protein n=1 Tax=Clavelina lepadiformis TaxID=159417 RepID=A0ABP0FJB8_CLALP